MSGEQPDRNPVARLGETLGRLPRYLALARGLAGDPGIARWRKGALAAAIAYLVSPIDLVPGIIPVAGQLDDLAVVLLGLRTALRGASLSSQAAHLERAGLSETDIAHDLATVRAAARWLARRAASAIGAAGRASAHVVAGAARLGIAAARGLVRARTRRG